MRSRSTESFEDALSSYRRASRPLLDREGSRTPWAVYATAAGSALALAGSGEAAVIHSGTQNVVLSVGASSFASASIDLDGSFGNDVRFSLLEYSTAQLFVGEAFVQALASSAGVRLNASNEVLKISSLGTVGGATNVIGAGDLNLFSRFVSSYVTSTTSGSTYTYFFTSSNAAGTWGATDTGFVGVRFDRGGQPHFGWLKLQLRNNVGPYGTDEITVVEWAYESQPNTPISLPEPSGLALLAAGAGATGGLNAWRRRKAARAQQA